MFDQIQHVLGDFVDLQAHLHLQRPVVKIKDPESGKILEEVRSNVPDLIVAVGTLAASPTTQPDANVLYRFRRGQSFAGEPDLVWTISGEKGEIRLVASGGTTLHANAYSEPVTIEIDDYETGKVVNVEWKWTEWQEELPIIARSVGALYEKFAEGSHVPSFADALARHEQLNRMLSTWNSHREGKLDAQGQY